MHTPRAVKSNQLISLKVGVMIGSTSRKNWLTFGDDLVPDTDSRSLFHFPHHCGIIYFGRFISISDAADFHDTRRNDANNVMNPQHFGSDLYPSPD